jgi:DNA-binding transcriptional LysR family regulator
VQPTPKAQRLADPVRLALATLEQALGETANFDPVRSSRTFQIRMSDIGESRFLPELMVALRERAPAARVQPGRCRATTLLKRWTRAHRLHRLPAHGQGQPARSPAGGPLHRAAARGPSLHAQAPLRPGPAAGPGELEFVAVRSHAETLRIVREMQLEERLRLVTEHFLGLPSIVKATDLAAIMPRNIARGFGSGYAIVEPAFPQREFAVSLEPRFEGDPGTVTAGVDRGTVQE